MGRVANALGIFKDLRQRALKYAVRELAPAEVVRNPADLLDWPEHSYERPTLLRFGREPNVEGVSVGEYSSLNGGTRILLGGNHHPEWVTTYPLRIKESLPGAYEDGQPATRGRITIGSDVWVGYDVIILSGVTINHGAVVGTGAVVTKDVPAYAIVAGNPAVVRRSRFDADVVAALLRIRWWEWPHDLIVSRADDLCSPDIQSFIYKYDTM